MINQPFKVTLEQRNECHIVHIYGDISAEDNERLAQTLNSVLDENPQRVVLDLTELSFVTSMGLGVLIQFRNDLEQKDIPLRLAGANEEISDIFLKTRLSELFPMFQSVEHALTD